MFVQEGVIGLSKRLEERQNDTSSAPVLSTKEFGEWIVKQLKDSDKTSINSIRRQLHELGHIIDFSLEFNMVVMNPVWLADTFKSILSFK